MTQERPPQTPAAVVASRVKELRKDKGWSAADLVAKCEARGLTGLTRSIVANLESGRRAYVTVEELFTFATVFDVPPPMLYIPLEDEQFAVTPNTVVSPWRVLRWIRGEEPLTQEDVAFWRTETEAAYELDKQHRRVQGDVQNAERGLRRAEFQGSSDAQVAAREQYARALEALAEAWRMTERHRFAPPRLPGQWIDDMAKLDIEHNPAWRVPDEGA